MKLYIKVIFGNFNSVKIGQNLTTNASILNKSYANQGYLYTMIIRTNLAFLIKASDRGHLYLFVALQLL
jgi:hypothetical protein